MLAQKDVSLGVCFGMSTSVADYFNRNQNKPPTLQGTETYDMAREDPSVLAALIAYHNYQLIENLKQGFQQFPPDPFPQPENVSQIYDEKIKPQIASEPVVLVVRGRTSKGEFQHVLVAYKATGLGNTVSLGVYDPNWPGQERTATLDLSQGKEGFAYDGGGELQMDAILYTIDSDSLRRLDLIPYEEIIPLTDTFRRTLAQAGYAQYAIGSPVNPVLIDNQGRRLGYIGDQLIEEIPNASVIKTPGNKFLFYVPASLQVQIELIATDNGTFHLNVAIPSTNGDALTVLDYTDVPIQLNTKATLKLDGTNPDKLIELDNGNDGTVDGTSPPNASGVLAVSEGEVTNTPPIISPLIPDIVIRSPTGDSVNLSGYKLDVEDSPEQLSFSLLNNNSDLFAATLSGDILTIVPVANQSGSGSIVLTLHDTSGGQVSQNIGVTIEVPSIIDVTSRVRVDASIAGYNRRTGDTTLNLTVTNTSGDAIRNPITVVFNSFSDAAIRVTNPDGQTDAGLDFVDFSALIPDGELSPGEVTPLKQVKLANPNKARLDFQVSVFGVVNTPGAAPPPKPQFAQPIHLIIPLETALAQNYPNPFNPETWIPFDLAELGQVTIEIYDIRGHRVRALHLGWLPVGSYVERDKAAHWDGRNDVGERVASGVYFYRFITPTFQRTKRMVILK